MPKALVVGCGMIAGLHEPLDAPGCYSHAKAYLRSGSFPQVGFFDIDHSRAQTLADKFGGQALSGTLLDAIATFNPDAISVCSPDDSHFSTTKTLLQSPGVHKIIFVEKPVCKNDTDLNQLLTLQRTSGTQVIVNHSRRFDSSHQTLRSIIQSERLGKILRCDIDYYGGWMHLGVHIVDCLRYLFGEDPSFHESTYRCDSKYPDDPTLDVIGTIKGAPLRIIGFDEKNYQIHDWNLKFENGQIKIDNFGHLISVLEKTINTEHEHVLQPARHYPTEGMKDAMPNAISLMAAFLKSGDTNPLRDVSLEDASQTMNALWSVKHPLKSRSE